MKIICKTKINACACIQNIFLLFRRDANDFWISWDCEISEKGVHHNGLKCLIIRARISSLWKYLFKKCVYVIKTLNKKQNVLKKFPPPPPATIEENSISKNKQDIWRFRSVKYSTGETEIAAQTRAIIGKFEKIAVVVSVRKEKKTCIERIFIFYYVCIIAVKIRCKNDSQKKKKNL